ncbi:hypothetical protein DXG01_000651 [Tephrocybe rancida]|nr:hypothetical protein DXG01_000651 [Tephrocybe rancida]
MSELAESLQKEIQGLSIEIRKLRTEREGLFRDIHDIMLSKSQVPPLDGSCLPPARPLSMHRKQSTQSLWFPILSVPPIPENEAAPKVEMGLFGPRSRVPSITEPPPTSAAPRKAESAPASPAPSVVRQRPIRSMSEGSPSPNSPSTPITPTRTAWRVVERKLESVYLARAAETAAST